MLLPPSEPKRDLDLSFKVPVAQRSIERSGKVSIYCHVQVSEADVGESGFGEAHAIELEVETEGGDLGARKACSAQVATRAIERENAKDSPTGSDIAKLQLYLAQICAADHLPCYRPAGSHKESVVDAKGKKRSIVVHDEYSEEHHTVTVDGRYGGDLAKGLWRFIYSYAGKEGWELGSVKTIDDRGKKASIPTSEITSVDVEKLLDAHQPTLTSLDQTSGGSALCSAVHRAGQPPLRASGRGRCAARRDRPPVSRAAGAADDPLRDRDREAGEGLSGRGRHRGFHQELDQQQRAPPGRRPDHVEARVPEAARRARRRGADDELPEGSSYVFQAGNARSISTTLHELCKKDNQYDILPSGAVGDDAKKHVLSIRAKDGRLINSLQLAGVPDLRVAQAQPTRAAAMLQLYLSAIPESADKPEGPRCYQVTSKGKDKVNHPVINGKWDKISLAALDRFKQGYGGGDDYKALVEAIEKAYASVGKPAAAPVEEAPAPVDESA